MSRIQAIPLFAILLSFFVPVPGAIAYPEHAPWSDLERYQESITRKEFDHLIKRFYNPSGVVYHYLDVNDQRAIIYNDRAKTKPDFTLRFAPNDASRKNPQLNFKTPAEYKAMKNPPDKPLRGVKIALDPGHIGGQWAGMEERQIGWANYPLIREGNANLLVANKVKPRLEALGATVYLTREKNEPVTSKRPADYMAEARAEGKTGTAQRRRAEMYFYRRQEIYERGQNLRRNFQPDFTISLHFNATELSGSGEVTRDNRHATFINAAYGPDEVDREMWRYFMFSKLLERSIPMEAALGDVMTEEILKSNPLPANSYAWTKYTCPINANPYNNGRNLAMTREFPGPTLLLEFFYMNHPWTSARMTAGDYEGEKYVEGAGGKYRSIYADYADAVVNGVRRLVSRWTVEGASDYPSTAVTRSAAKPGPSGQYAAAPVSTNAVSSAAPAAEPPPVPPPCCPQPPAGGKRWWQFWK